MSYLSQFLLILALVLLGSTKATLQSAMGKRYIKCAQDSVLFNIVFFLAIAVFVLLFFGIGPVTLPLIGWAAAVSAFSVVFQMIYSIALSMGPVSLTVLIINCSVFISTIASVIMFREQIYLPQIIAVGFLVLSMVLSMKRSPDGRQVSVKWFTLSLTAMTATGIASALQKMFSVFYAADTDGKTANTFLFLLYFLGALMLLGVYLITAYTGKKQKSTAGIPRGMAAFAIAMGAVLCVYQKVNVTGMAIIDGAFLYPTYTGLSSVVMSFVGILLFRDELNNRQKWGIVCGILSVVLMNVRCWPL